MKLAIVSALFACLVLVACSPDPGDRSMVSDSGIPSADEDTYIVLDKDLQQLKDDFNAGEGRVRLLFISGPTCGICLRGMADLNDAFIAAAQNDDRLETFVIHVPTLGAKEEHVADTIPLLNGPRIHHYWEDSGIVGSHFSDVMDVNMYVWDFWAIYGPDARWDTVLPPKPDYYEHQLGSLLGQVRGFPRDRILNAARFASEAEKLLEQVDGTGFAVNEEDLPPEADLVADGTMIPVVAQPRNVAVSQHIRNRGGYNNLKRIFSISKRGRWLTGDREFLLRVDLLRPNQLSRQIQAGGEEFVAEVTENGAVRIAGQADIGLPSDLERALLDTFEFDGPLVEWPGKGSQIEMIGMQKIGNILAWKLDLIQSGGQHWHLYINSHGGALARADLLGDDKNPLYTILQSDVREVDGFKYPHRIEYQNRDGETLGVEVFDEIVIGLAEFALSDETAAHQVD